VGRGFRTPNLVESFFNGPVPEGTAWQIANDTLKPETNLEFDLGARYQGKRIYAEAWYFNNTIHDGIATVPTGDTINGLPAYQNKNVTQLRYQGVEAILEGRPADWLSVTASYTYLNSPPIQPNAPTGDTYPHKVGVTARYQHPSGRFWAQYGFRWNAQQSNVPPTPPLPVGPVLPSFAVNDLAAGVRIYDRGRVRPELNVAVLNLYNALYAETANQSFFRPEPQRQVRVSVVTTF
jgi:outer membrane receptor protein involved in Fe transport